MSDLAHRLREYATNGWLIGAEHFDVCRAMNKAADALDAAEAALGVEQRSHAAVLSCIQDDLADLIRALGHQPVAEPIPPHQVMRRCIDEVAVLRADLIEYTHLMAALDDEWDDYHRMGAPRAPERISALIGFYFHRQERGRFPSPGDEPDAYETGAIDALHEEP